MLTKQINSIMFCKNQDKENTEMHICKTAFAIEYFQICIIDLRFCLSSTWNKNRFIIYFFMNPKCKQNFVESVYETQPLLI